MFEHEIHLMNTHAAGFLSADLTLSSAISCVFEENIIPSPV